LHIPEERVKAIVQVKAPENVHQLKAFFGLVNYYGRFFRNMSSLASPLYYLLKPNVKFFWSPEQNKAFANIKNNLLSKTVLTHYDTTLELVLACDASPKGIGAVLSHRFPDKLESLLPSRLGCLVKVSRGILSWIRKLWPWFMVLNIFTNICMADLSFLKQIINL
jgi:hypothetical protein